MRVRYVQRAALNAAGHWVDRPTGCAGRPCLAIGGVTDFVTTVLEDAKAGQVGEVPTDIAITLWPSLELDLQIQLLADRRTRGSERRQLAEEHTEDSLLLVGQAVPVNTTGLHV